MQTYNLLIESSWLFVRNIDKLYIAGKHVVFGKLSDMGLSFAVVKKIEKFGSKSGSVSKVVLITDCGEIQ